MRVFIPELGTILTLAQPWTFTIINENRNRGLAALRGVKNPDYYFPFGTEENKEISGGWNYRQRVPVDPGTHTLEAGTNLEVDRIYVRKGNEEFSSVTFKMRVGSKMIRFFAKLDDINKIEL